MTSMTGERDALWIRSLLALVGSGVEAPKRSGYSTYSRKGQATKSG